MFKNNKCQQKRLYVLLALSFLFKTTPIKTTPTSSFPLAMKVVKLASVFIGGAWVQGALDRQYPEEPGDSIRRLQFTLDSFIKKTFMHGDEAYYNEKIAMVNETIRRDKVLLDSAKDESNKCKSYLDSLELKTGEHTAQLSNKLQLKTSEHTAHELLNLITQARKISDNIERNKQLLEILQSKLDQVKVQKIAK